MVSVFGLGGRRELPESSDEAEPWSDEHEEDSGSDPPGSGLELRATDAQRPAEVTSGHTWMNFIRNKKTKVSALQKFLDPLLCSGSSCLL